MTADHTHTSSPESTAGLEAEVVALARHLIDIESISGNEAAVATALESWLTARGWVVKRQAVAPGRDNLLAHRPGKTNPRVLFNSHIDTVPGFFPSRIEGEYLFGRGACDTKSLIAAQLLAAEALVQHGFDDVGLLYVVGEEVDNIGMKTAAKLGLNPRFLIVAEPTESKLASQHKGIMQFRLSAEGKAAHSGYPELGHSAIDDLVEVLHDLIHTQWPGGPKGEPTTLNIGLIAGGTAINVVPEKAEARLLFRIAASVHETKTKLYSVVADRARIDVADSVEPIELGTVDGYETQPVAFFTDIPYFKFDGTALLFGPGSFKDAHTSHERIRIADLVKAVGAYQDLARKVLST